MHRSRWLLVAAVTGAIGAHLALRPGAAPPPHPNPGAEPPVPVASNASGSTIVAARDASHIRESAPTVRASRPVVARAAPAPDPTQDIWERSRPIFETLPHFPQEDIYKLRYYCRADFDKNDEINAQDLLLFLDALADPSHPLSAWTDITGDGTIDAQDLLEFIRALEAPCDPQERRQARSTIC